MFASNGFFMRFVRLNLPFWQAEQHHDVRRQTLLLVGLTVAQMLIAVSVTEWSAALFNALEQHSMSSLLSDIALLLVLFAINMAVTFYHLTTKRRLQISWRAWLTERVTQQWMRDGRHYQVTHIKSAEHDNPDGRIAEDIRIATEEAVNLSHSLFYSVLLLCSFTVILWQLSGALTVDLGFTQFTLHGYLVWIALFYAISASLLGWHIGRPLTHATDARQTVEANFRFDLVTVRENSQAIALIHSENNEKRRFVTLFSAIQHAYQYQTQAMSRLILLSSGYSVLSMAVPVLAAAPRYILGSITLGSLMQSVQAFQQTTAALSWPVDNMSAVAQWRASVERVLSLIKALDDLEQELTRPDPNRIVLEKNELRPALRFEDLCIAKLDGLVCISLLNETIRAGERVWIDGNSTKAAKLFKAIAGLWPWGEGRIELPDDEPMFFMPPRPYLPMGTLREAICYPDDVSSINQQHLVELINTVGVHDVLDQLDKVDMWDKCLAREQQQRLGVVRLLLKQPKWILVQEAFDSLSPDDEMTMFRLICQQLPNAALITITNQPTAQAFHQRRIKLY